MTSDWPERLQDEVKGHSGVEEKERGTYQHLVQYRPCCVCACVHVCVCVCLSVIDPTNPVAVAIDPTDRRWVCACAGLYVCVCVCVFGEGPREERRSVSRGDSPDRGPFRFL